MEINDIKELVINSKLKQIESIDSEIVELRSELECCADEINEYKDKRERLEKEIEDIKNNNFKDKFGEPSIQFEHFAGLSDYQLKELNTWIINHEQVYHTNSFYNIESLNSNNPYYEIRWSPTHVGDLASCICTTCKRKVFENKLYNYNPTNEEKNQYYQYLGEW